MMRRVGVAAGIVPAILVVFGIYFGLDGQYFVHQGIGYVRTVVFAEEISALRASGELDEETERLFDRVAEIRRFAYEELGLAQSDNFTRYTELERDYLLSVISKVHDDRMQRVSWSYPVVGDLFYRGFFDPAQARTVATGLRAQGYDVLVRRVDAFSSLGYFPDPVYSFMADYSDCRLANLIIHEEMHSTVWLDGQNVYNEEIATFVGDEGAAQFVREKHGPDSKEYRAIADGRADRRTYRRWMSELHARLSNAYRQLETRRQRLLAKENILAESQETLRRNYDSMFRTVRYRGAAERPLHNARVDAGYKYGGDLSLYYDLYELLDQDLAAVVELIRQSEMYPGAPRAFIRSFVEQGEQL